jgi:hypothetical protein
MLVRFGTTSVTPTSRLGHDTPGGCVTRLSLETAVRVDTAARVGYSLRIHGFE